MFIMLMTPVCLLLLVQVSYYMVNSHVESYRAELKMGDVVGLVFDEPQSCILNRTIRGVRAHDGKLSMVQVLDINGKVEIWVEADQVFPPRHGKLPDLSVSEQ
jgi:hypothetical protein